MKKTVFVHIGSHKTGTTAIQSFFALNRNLFKEKGILYPGIQNAHHDMAWELEKTGSVNELLNQNSLTAKILQEIRETSCTTIILSAEAFSETRTSEKLKQVFTGIPGDPVSIKIIIYVRRQDDIIQSAYQEQLKTPKLCIEKSLSDFLRENTGFSDRWNWYKKIRPWTETFGKEAIIVRVYEKNQFYKNDLIRDFLFTIGRELTDDFRLPAKEQSNIGMGLDALEIMRICNAKIEDPEIKKILRNSLVKIDPKGILEPYSLLSPKDRNHFIREYEPGNQKVAREYLGREDGILFFEPLPDPDEPWKPYEGLTVEKVVPVLTWMIFTMNKKFQHQLQESEKY
jgi:hypothetical protein